MNIQHGPDLSSVDRSCLWERLDSVSKTRRALREKGEQENRRGGEQRSGGAVTLWVKSNEQTLKLYERIEKYVLRSDAEQFKI